jgi:hypothetical protein
MRLGRSAKAERNFGVMHLYFKYAGAGRSNLENGVREYAAICDIPFIGSLAFANSFDAQRILVYTVGRFQCSIPIADYGIHSCAGIGCCNPVDELVFIFKGKLDKGIRVRRRIYIIPSFSPADARPVKRGVRKNIMVIYLLLTMYSLVKKHQRVVIPDLDSA